LIISINKRASPEQIAEMLLELGFYIKLAVDLKRRVIAGGGEMHFDCEQVLIAEGSNQEDIWGAGLMPMEQKITYDSLINIRPHQNRSMEILDLEIKDEVSKIIKDFLGDV
jgi:Protein of unknown function (DUF5674)